MSGTGADELWLGLDVGATKVHGLLWRPGEPGGEFGVVAEARVASRREEGPRALYERTCELARELQFRAGRARGIGVGFAGLVDAGAGRVRSSIMLPGWEEFPLAEELCGRLELPVALENDATAAGLGEYVALGSPPGLNMVLLTVGTGIGGAILIDGRLYRGARGLAGELGNTTVDWRGPQCWCGNRGCLNALASGSAIAEASRRGGAGLRETPREGPVHPVSVESVVAAARGGQARAARAIEEAARALGAGVANFINIFNPDRVVLAGGVAELGGDWLELVRREAARRAFPESMEHAVLALSVLGPRTGAFGAAALARERFGGTPRD